MRTISKAFAYVTHRSRLLILRHPHAPQAGLQVPSGTIQAEETPAKAVLREANEETGLRGLVLERELGVAEFDMTPFGRPELQRRHFFHVGVTAEPPDTWRHWEMTPTGGAEPILFEFFWAELPSGIPPLIAGHDAFLGRLK